MVSLNPVTTEVLFAIGAGAQVVGRTAWCDYPAAAAQVPNLGDAFNPSVEPILASRPDLVVFYDSPSNSSAVERLRDVGVPVARFRTDRLADVPRVAALLGRLTGHTREADSVAGDFAVRLEAATVTPPEGKRRLTVFMLAWNRPPITIGAGSFLNELVERAGGANVFNDIAAPSGAVSIEAVTARDPDLILNLSNAAPRLVDQPEWRSVGAVRARRFITVGGSEFNRPSPRSPDAIRRLAAEFAERER